MRVLNPSSTNAVTIHDGLQDGRSYQYQPGIRDVVVAPGATVAIPNADAAQSRSLQTLLANATLTLVDFLEPFDATSFESAMAGFAAGIQVISRSLVDVTLAGGPPSSGTTNVTLPADVVSAADDYIVMATVQNADLAAVGPDATVVIENKTDTDFDVTVVAGAGAGDAQIAVLVLKII